MNDDVHQAPAGLPWRKSSFSQGENDCVEVTYAPGGAVWVRDTKNRQVAFGVTASEWAAFIHGITSNEAD